MVLCSTKQIYAAHSKSIMVKGQAYNFFEELFRQVYILTSTQKKPLSSGFVNNTGADQPAHSRSLISAFVIPLLESIISKLAPFKFSIF